MSHSNILQISDEDWLILLEDMAKHGSDGIANASQAILAGVAAAAAAVAAPALMAALGLGGFGGIMGGILGALGLVAVPIWWPIGAAALAGGSVYGLTKLIRNGGAMDERAKKQAEKIRKKILEKMKRHSDEKIKEFGTTLKNATREGRITTNEGCKIFLEVAEGNVPPDKAIQTVRNWQNKG